MSDREPILSPADSHEVETLEWGRLVWMVAGRFGNSDSMTVGRCDIAPGRENPRHYHPNCDEVLLVIEGTIEHLCGDEYAPMGPGDAISIPAGVVHHARNVGAENAVVVIAFSSAHRETVAV
jgi:quercetin dioxygenase-like cupin family protein